MPNITILFPPKFSSYCRREENGEVSTYVLDIDIVIFKVTNLQQGGQYMHVALNKFKII